MAITINASTSSGFVTTADTSGQIELQANGATKATVGSSGLSIGQYNPSASLITSGTVVSASGTSVDFTGIPSWVKRVTVIWDGVSTNGSSSYLLQLGSGSFTTSGYNSVACYGGSASGGTIYTAGFGVFSGSSSNVNYGQFVLTLRSSNVWVCTYTLVTNTAGTPYFFNGGGSVSLSGALDRLRNTTSNGTDTFDAGTINILYE